MTSTRPQRLRWLAAWAALWFVAGLAVTEQAEAQGRACRSITHPTWMAVGEATRRRPLVCIPRGVTWGDLIDKYCGMVDVQAIHARMRSDYPCTG